MTVCLYFSQHKSMWNSLFWEASHNLNSDFGKKKTKEKNKQTSNFYKRPNEKHVWACAFLFISTVNLCVNTISHFYRYCLFTFYAFSKSSKLLTITCFTWKFSDGVFPLSQHFDEIIFVLVLALHDTNFWDRLAKVWSKRRWSIHN